MGFLFLLEDINVLSGWPDWKASSSCISNTVKFILFLCNFKLAGTLYMSWGLCSVSVSLRMFLDFFLLP